MLIQERTIGNVTILDVDGKMTLGEGDELLYEKITDLIGTGRRQIVLNMQQTPYIDSAALSEIVRSYTRLSRMGGKVKLLAISKRVQDLLEITKLKTVFETFQNEAEAVASFSR